jgi:hypothetical protein
VKISSVTGSAICHTSLVPHASYQERAGAAIVRQNIPTELGESSLGHETRQIN